MKKQKNIFLNNTPQAFAVLQNQLMEIVPLLAERLQINAPIAKSEDLTALLNNTKHISLDGDNFNTIIEKKLRPLLPHMIDVNHPWCAAHLHCPPLISSITTELLIASLNLSMDSWDQSGIATLIEEQVIGWLGTLLGYDANSDGVFTSGGTQSNLMGVLLAREAFAKRHQQQAYTRVGLHQQHKPLAILTTERAHFSITQAARWLGIGSDNVIIIDFKQTEDSVRQICTTYCPFLFAATAGCTDFGEIDPLNEIRKICNAFHLWMHVDAAVGGALLLTKYKKRLHGIETADSVTIDFHKLFFQPISGSALIVKNKLSLAVLRFHSDYLNRHADEVQGTINLVNKSMQTTRRFDALKIWISWQHLGIKTVKKLIETLIQLTHYVAELIEKEKQLELLTSPSINTILFRFVAEMNQNERNQKIRRQLFATGKAIIGETTYHNSVFLKLTLMNPMTSKKALQRLLSEIVKAGEALG